MADESCQNITDKNIKKQKRFTSKNHNLKKRQPHKYQTGDNIIYVSSKSNVKAVLERCSKLVVNGEIEIIIYCMGAAIQRGILLALQLCEKHVAFKIDANTLTSDLVDDLEPTCDEVDYEIQKRQNSALKIRVFRIPIET